MFKIRKWFQKRSFFLFRIVSWFQKMISLFWFAINWRGNGNVSVCGRKLILQLLLFFYRIMSSSTTMASSTSGQSSVFPSNVTTPTPPTTPWSSVPPHAEPIFLQTKLAQGIAGAFVWIALFLTCQQVCYRAFYWL